MADPSFAAESKFADLETPRVPNKLQSITALARFEFEPGKGNDGTKILMVEWEDDDVTRSPVGSWHVSWNGKRTVLPADEQANDHVRRCYFLLPPGTTIPPVVTLTYEPPPSSASTVKKQDTIQVNPLPAIFPPELGVTARSAGKKGVLHTIWAKKRLQVLEKEIRAESAINSEGVALEMALQEKTWIETNFGVGGRQQPSALQTSALPAAPLSPTNTPISPTGGKKLAEKLKGLKLQTSEMDLRRRNSNIATSRTPDPDLHPLSPDGGDLAISSFTSFHTITPVSLPTQNTTNNNKSSDNAGNSIPSGRPIVAHHPPPEHIQFQQQHGSGSGFASLSMNPIHDNSSNSGGAGAADSGDGLFAKALSPRSPDIPRSPFSFSSEETMPQIMQKLKG